MTQNKKLEILVLITLEASINRMYRDINVIGLIINRKIYCSNVKGDQVEEGHACACECRGYGEIQHIKW